MHNLHSHLNNIFTPNYILEYAKKDHLIKDYKYKINGYTNLFIYQTYKPEPRYLSKIEFRINSLRPKKWKGQLEIHLYPTKFKKCFPNMMGSLLDVDNINSGVTTSYSYINFQKIVIFRNEELMKVLVHELLHAYGYGDHDYVNFNYNKILDISPTYNLLLNEAYIEFNAVIYNIYLIILESKLLINPKVQPIFDKRLFEQMIKKEISYSVKKVAQILNFFGYKTFQEFQNPDKGSMYKFKEKTSVISYFIIKLFILNNYEKYIYFNSMNTNNNNNIINVLGDPDKENDVTPTNLFNQPELINEINNRMIMNEISNLAVDHPDNSLRMTVFG